MSTFSAAVQNTPVLSHTQNGMVTLQSSLNNTVDLFFTIGASRGKDLTAAFESAYSEDPTTALRLLFWARDIRGGAGERDTFKKLLKNLEMTHPDSLMKNLHLVSEYGRWDDLLIFQSDRFKLAAYKLINDALRNNNGLAAKWMPRKGKIASELRTYMNYSPKQYRKLLVGLTKVVETQMCAKDWSNINYDHVPSVAAARYQKAFKKNDEQRYANWKESLASGTGKINASAVYPYDVIKSTKFGDEQVALAQWNSLPNYLGDNKILPMVDVSGSMETQVGGQKGVGLTCMEVAISLGLYIADKQTGAFKDCYLSFTNDSKIHVLTGNLLAKMKQIEHDDVGYSTNIESAFRSILQLAVKNNIPQTEMPTYLLVLSDMEFNPAFMGNRSVGAFDLARKMFESAGYKLPKIVWWNLNGRVNAKGNSPVTFDQEGTALVSGFSPSIMVSILKAKQFTPYDIMMETLDSDRYKKITA